VIKTPGVEVEVLVLVEAIVEVLEEVGVEIITVNFPVIGVA